MRGLVITFLIGSACGLVACSEQAADAPITQTAPVTVVISEAQLASVAQMASVPGSVTREHHARLASAFGGQVSATPVAAGSVVKQGDLLIEVGAADAQARLASARAQLTTSEAEARQAQADEARFKALLAEGVVAPREYEQVHQRYLAAKAQAQAAQHMLKAAETNLSYAEIRAPFDGMLVTRTAKLGDYAAPGYPLAEVAGGAAQVELQVGDALYPQLSLGAPVAVHVDKAVYPARVVERIDAADPVTRSHKVKLQLQGDTAPAPGVYAVAQVPVGQRDVLSVAADAVIERAGLVGVFVLDEQSRAQFRSVRIANGGAEGQVLIASGLQAGEQVIRGPALNMSNGLLVSPAVGRSHD